MEFPGTRTYRITIPDAMRDAADGQWLEVEGIKLMFDGDRVDIILTTDIALQKRAEREPRIAPRPPGPDPIRWR